MHTNKFKLEVIKKILDSVRGLTLGEADKKGIFDKPEVDKNKGIAGNVIQQSVLDCPADNKQEPDIIVDGIKTELKVTGLRKVKKGKHDYKAKEPMSITAVSPNRIINEDFNDSALWHKLEHMLLVYYLYDSDITVLASEYAEFPILGYQFHEFEENEKEILKKDWELVRNFLRNVHNELDNPSSKYHEISKLRENMLFMDTAPKYPNSPRFRLKQSVVSTIVQKHFGIDFKHSYDYIKFNSTDDLNEILHKFSSIHKNKSISQIAFDLSIELKRNSEGKVSKSITERVLTSAFGATAGKLRQIEIFAKIGIIPKTIAISSKGARTEDTKLDAVDFSEWTDTSISFEDSSLYNYFANHVILFSIFQEPTIGTALEDSVFLGFKRITFNDDFIYAHVKPTWDKVRELIIKNELVVSETLTKYGSPRVNKSGTTMEATNFPKAKDYVVFLRGTGQDSTNKTFSINGFQMYPQNFWIKGNILVEMLSKIDFI